MMKSNLIYRYGSGSATEMRVHNEKRYGQFANMFDTKESLAVTSGCFDVASTTKFAAVVFCFYAPVYRYEQDLVYC
jgi:hypothetical protein